MRTSIFPAFLFSLLLLCAGVTQGSAADLTILSPAIGELLEGELVTVVVRINDAAVNGVAVTRNNTENIYLSVQTGKKIACKVLHLTPGANDIQVSALKGTLVTESHRLSLYYLAEPMRERISPPGFRKVPFHTENREKACLPCHAMDPAEKDMKPKTPADSVCYQCHKGITAYRNVHGPSARWECLACHARTRTAELRRYITRTPEKDACFSCHSDSKKTWLPKKVMHKPIESGRCTICHNPHASPNFALARKPIWDLCVTCHGDKASGLHVAAGFSGLSHPTKGKSDPLQPERELSCVSCHDPHTGISRFRFVKDLKDSNELCQACHKF
jgi:predicted CXXCH cytochrome family protein